MASPQTTSSGLFPWGRYRIPTGELLETRLGALTIRLKKEGDEVRFSHEREGNGPRHIPGQPREGEWKRWAASGDLEEVEILPAFPDLPLVLQPENPFRLLPGAKARIFVRAPVWLQLRIPGKQGGLLAELPTRILSETWWGSFADGEIAYWLNIMARREATADTFLPERVICPLALENRSREDLPVEKVVLRVPHLSIFRGSQSLWSDEVRIRYQGEEEGSELEMTGRTPAEAPGANRMASPRVPVAKGFSARTFARLKGIPGFGTA